MNPRTPQRSRSNLHGLIDTLNEKYGLEIAWAQNASPANLENKTSRRWKLFKGLKILYWRPNILSPLLHNFDEWTAARPAQNRRHGAPSSCDGLTSVSDHERDERMKYLEQLVSDEVYLMSKGSITHKRIPEQGAAETAPDLLPKKPRLSEDEDNFHTAPNSPIKNYGAAQNSAPTSGKLEIPAFEKAGVAVSNILDTTPVLFESKQAPPSSFIQRLTGREPPASHEIGSRCNMTERPPISFSTATASSVFASHSTRLGNSFDTDATEVTDSLATQSTYADSVVGYMLSEEMTRSIEATQSIANKSCGKRSHAYTEDQVIEELLRAGPFSIEQSLPVTVPLRHCYELERIGRAWDLPLDCMLRGGNLPHKSHDRFWEWIGKHNQRNGKPLPEKSSRRVWDAAVGDFKTDRHSEAVVMTGELDWCVESKPGIFKLRLNPLKAERTCRFYRRFGSDRFLTLTLPAPSRPPRHLANTSEPSILRESIAAWLTRHDHHCVGRTWRPFYVEEVKSKRKTKLEPRFRVEFFAIDGVDFDHRLLRPPVMAPSGQGSESHTPMSVEALLEWHMPREANINQSNCKLFQRIHLGLSKTFATITLKRTQIYWLRDDPNRAVMNDGCALMSRNMAKHICDCLGIPTATPSAFQGRIAGAKGLWMVDRHEPSIKTKYTNDTWIQISDSQLKIQPHPQDWKGPTDDEQLTFEVVNWAKPLRPVDLNIQLLAILEQGGNVKEYIATLTRAGIETLYDDFAEVIRSNSHVLCRGLMQKLRPSGDEGAGKVRRLEQWMANDAECIIRMAEAGFAPQTFYPLRVRLRKYLTWLLDRHVEDLHIQVPLSTYAYCVADPYRVLEADEVHFGFSQNWRDPRGQFEDNLLDGVDVLVGRLPAHFPSDIQRRRAVWKAELRHFKNVIVFPTKGDVPLAHMLSGGDYDGDTPWICWDPAIVNSFRNSDLPLEEYTTEHFGLTKHSVPMAQVQSTEEFLEGAFAFNLTMSNLGRCTVEHEKLAYDESIDSAKAKELACLLSHLVDGRKSGVHLAEQAWQEYLKTISPKQRSPPAYRNPQRRPKQSNIVDYLKFVVAEAERTTVLTQLEKCFPESECCNLIDQDLVQPWRKTSQAAQSDYQHGSGCLNAALNEIKQSVDGLYKRWVESCSSYTEPNKFSAVARDAAAGAAALRPPQAGSYPLIHMWRNSQTEWMRLLASYTYQKYPQGSFVFYAFGETLCDLKASATPSRRVVNDALACYRVNQKMVARITARELDAEDGAGSDADEYEGEDAIEALLFGRQGPVEYYDGLEDGCSVERLVVVE